MSIIKLTDQEARDLFTEEIEVNCAMVAPAGVGKTYSIVERIVRLVRHPNATDWLPRLVVVTYTNAAAIELQKRARLQLTRMETEAKLPPGIIPAFNQSFFGTIHSFCLFLLRKYGHFIGVPSRIEYLGDDEDSRLWMRFIQKQGHFSSRLSDAKKQDLLRFVPIQDLFGLARNTKPGIFPDVPGDCPRIHAGPVFEFRHKAAKSQKNVERSQQALRNWLEALEKQPEFLPLPKLSGEIKDFTALWNDALGPLQRWIEQSALVVTAEMARAYQDFRVGHGFLSYDDQVTLAANLFEHPEAARWIRSEDFRIILDEAQDTDPKQFRVLLEAARHPDASSLLPRPGHLSMVGDSQQSIHGSRASLGVYRESHHRVTEPPGGREATLYVTHRCSERVVRVVNELFGNIFRPNEGQTPFVPLQTHPDAGPGAVMRLPVEDLPTEKKRTLKNQSIHEARQLARFLKEKGPSGLGADSWGQVALLCARKEWFGPLKIALQEQGLEFEVQAHREIRGDDPACAWFTALAWIMAHPRDGYEIVGVLREIYGLSDDELAHFANRRSDSFQILRAQVDCSTRGAVAPVLHQLFLLRQQVLQLPLRAAACEIIRATALRERLQMLPDASGVEESLDEMLVQAASAELQRMTLVEWSRALNSSFYKVRDFPESAKDVIHVLSCHKSKGLEWQTVIVPCMFRGIRFQGDRYPRYVTAEHNQVPRIAFDKKSSDKTLEELIALQQAQELERLLYVTCTRAKNTLIFVDDRILFGFDPEKEKTSFGQLLLANNNINENAWNGLPETLDIAAGPKPSPRSSQPEKLSQSPVNVKLTVPSTPEFPRRTTPHQLANYSEPGESEIRREMPDDFFRNDAERAETYGAWWHETMQLLPWTQSPSAWNKTFTSRLELSPQISRAKNEWKLFLESEIARQLQQKALVIRSEMPFLWNDKPGSVIEGIVDLACFDPAKKEWLILDWKTNRLGDGGLPRLREIYEPQINVYVRAWKALFGGSVRGGLYSTELGEWQQIGSA